MLYFYGLTSQIDHLNKVSDWLKTNGLSVDMKFADINEDAKIHVQQYGFTVLPVLFHIGGPTAEMIKISDGGNIMNMTAEQIAAIKAMPE